MQYLTCPHCGQSGSDDNNILSSEISSLPYSGGEVVITQTRQCDICQKQFKVDLTFGFKYEQYHQDE